MTAHLTVPAIEPENIPATVSRRVLTGLLREELGFKGLIVTDAMDMAGLAKQFASGEASVRAIEAGADVLLMPPDPDAAIRAVLKPPSPADASLAPAHRRERAARFGSQGSRGSPQKRRSWTWMPSAMRSIQTTRRSARRASPTAP